MRVLYKKRLPWLSMEALVEFFNWAKLSQNSNGEWWNI